MEPDIPEGTGDPTATTQKTANSFEQLPQRVTPEDVEKAKAQEREANTHLMDEMETSVDSQGQWFVRLGDKKPIVEQRSVSEPKFLGMGSRTVTRDETVGHEDTRAFVLRGIAETRAYEADLREITVVTPEGIFVAPYYKGDLEREANDGRKTEKQREFELLQKLISGETPVEDAKYLSGPPYEGASHNQPRIEIAGNRIRLERPQKDYNGVSFGQRVEQSIALTESPHKANLETVTNQTQIANEAVDMISSLPPR